MLNCVIKKMSEVLTKELSFVYSPGIPKLFQMNYLIAKQFWSQLDNLNQDSLLLISELKKKFNMNT